MFLFDHESEFQFSSRYVNRKSYFPSTDLSQPSTCCFVYNSSVSIYPYALCIMILGISQNFYCLYIGNAKQM